MPNLRVLDMQGMHVLSLSSTFELLKNLRALSLEGCKWLEDKCELHEKLVNLEILSINNNTIIRELPEVIGRLTNLMLLDMRGCSNLKIPPSVFSCLQLLEDLHTGGWRPAEEGGESGNASFGQLESLSKLTFLATWVPHARLLPKSDFLKKLKRYAIVVGDREDLTTMKYLSRNFFLVKTTKNYLSQNCFLEKSLSLEANCIDDAPLGGGIDQLLKQSTETLYLRGDGLKIVLDQLFPEGSIHLRKLYIDDCDGRVKYLVPPNIKVFEKLEKLILNNMRHLKEICHGQQLPAGRSFGFPKLIKISLRGLRSLTCFYKGMDQINLPQLTDLDIELLPKLTSFCAEGNRNVGLQSLFNHKVKLTNLKNLLLKGLDDMTEIWSDQLDGDSFHQLKKVEVYDCDRISTVLRCNMTQVIQNLEELSVQGCELVEGVFEHGEEGSVAVVLLPRLKVLKLFHLPKLTQIWKKHIRMNHDFRELSFIRIEECHSMKHVFSTSVAKALVKLQELQVERCEMMEQIVANDHPEGDTSELSGMMEFQNLTTLSLVSLYKLKTFSSSSFQNAEINKQPLFGNQVKLTNLKNLLLKGLDDMTEIWSDQLDGDSFHQLKKVEVCYCDRISTVLRCNMTQVLQNLEELTVQGCKLVEGVFELSVKGDTSELSGMMEFQNLRSLSLHNLDELKSFSSSSFMNAEINSQPLFGNQVTFPILEKLDIYGLPNFEELWCSQIPTGSFQKVRVLNVSECDKLVNIIPSHLLKVFSSLEKLEVSDCHSLEELFDSKGVSIEEGYHATLIETLKSIIVENCGHIRNLFPSSIARGLVHLQRLEVKSCPMIEEIFMEKADEDGRENKTLFPALEILKLGELPRLKSFCNVNYTIELPVLYDVRIFDCSEMTTFSSSFIRTRTPKLGGVNISDDWIGKIIWMGDLNKTIEHLFKEKETQEQESEDGSDEHSDG